MHFSTTRVRHEHAATRQNNGDAIAAAPDYSHVQPLGCQNRVSHTRCLLANIEKSLSRMRRLLSGAQHAMRGFVLVK
jgi:hypothetical protein